ncbi:PepSY domain-containing protein [Streptomyces sp. TRM68367]|uniref:PepSY domain-containing protein n=1 Tax=Streptomyces sp. TRM68367 TaxID=2758415 RepID=UPI00165C7D39|nr:PepSY domain-containing protein [Streptomyces sp. TRM68367]MBC9727371.1 PepSY domain-containing protein [Streptomyces sp. TRM68367]
MKRNIVIAAVTASALIGGGTATALAVTGDDGGSPAHQTDVRLSDGVRDDDGARDDADDRHDRHGQDDRDDRDDDGIRGDDAEAARAGSVDVTAPEAIAAALKHTAGTAVSADLDDEDDGPVMWNVDVLGGDDTWHSVRVDPAGGKVLGSHSEREDDTAEVRAALKGTSVTAEEAARAAVGKGTVTSVDLDEDGGAMAWDVETHTPGKAGQDRNVDLDSGKVTADRPDDDD